MSKFTDFLGCVRDLGVDTLEVYHQVAFLDKLSERDYDLFLEGIRNFLREWNEVHYSQIFKK